MIQGTITNTFQHQVFTSKKEAMKFGINELGWNKDDILERKERITLEVDNEIEREELDCLMIDAGSDDYLYYINQ